ncbi:acetolactate decarboxylase [Clostridium sp. DJ247]|uniref:acetolactate decarboxylase n=1 Tax=Clostridium sp. DJ247 TaxID=2726188 RepID=UPI0016243AF5|nr:acetolactate decarboxylase [Clostridium sp. DJ247]MBC2582320.1 acetolactate decarboxylase [Clostridium sp. DJ247]
MKKTVSIVLSALMVAYLSGCSASNSVTTNAQNNSANSTVASTKEPGVLYQSATIHSLMQGVYDGETTIKDIKEHGDFGLGTFNELDGEMILLDSKVYQVKSTGEVKEVEDSQKTPFNDVVFFKADKKVTLTDVKDMKDLQAKLDKELPSKNIFFAFKSSGKFSYVKTRSVPKQNKPYPVLVEASKQQQFFEKNDVSGTVVGFKCPSYVEGVNVAGYHLHFLSDDKKFGGHGIDFKADKMEVEIQYLYKFNMNLPSDKEFLNVNLEKNQNKDVEKVESGK